MNMKIATALLPLAAAAMACAGPAPAQTAGCATVEVENVRPQQGHLMLAAYASAEDFGKKPLASLRLPAGEARMRFVFCGLSGEAVALTLFQDLDSDGRMGKNVLGVPSEPWGASGTPGAFGPAWDTGKVPLDGRAITVRLSP
ncbi:MAG TPA: DUF2141 domain-containing protein [Rubrivivax sp.]|nr:DUF2141 domain-containing protein [Rubrivivax sp.]